MMVLIRSLARWVPSHRRQGLAGMTALILIVHLLSVVLLAGNALSPDERLYISLAENLLATGTFGREPGVPFALVPPLYPLFVATIFALSGDSLLAVRIAQAIIGTANSLVVFGLATTLFPRRPAVAWLSMLGIGLYPVFFLWDGRILTETVYVLITLLSWWCWTRAVHSPTPISVLMAGAGFGLSMLIRETLLFFIPIVVVAGLLIIRRQWLRYVVLSAATILTRPVSIAPGGLGIREGIGVGVASVMGFDPGISVVAVGIDRLIATLVIIVVGTVYTYILSRKVARPSHEPGSVDESWTESIL